MFLSILTHFDQRHNVKVQSKEKKVRQAGQPGNIYSHPPKNTR